MFVIERLTENATKTKRGFPTRTTIDHERGMELSEIWSANGEIYLVLNIEGKDILICADYRFTGENKNVIEYFIRNIGQAYGLEIEAYTFSSNHEKLQIVKYVEEALKVFGLHHCLSPGQSVEVKFSDFALSFPGRAQ